MTLCWRPFHPKNECKARDVICAKCGKLGHHRRVCRSASNSSDVRVDANSQECCYDSIRCQCLNCCSSHTLERQILLSSFQHGLYDSKTLLIIDKQSVKYMFNNRNRCRKKTTKSFEKTWIAEIQFWPLLSSWLFQHWDQRKAMMMMFNHEPNVEVVELFHTKPKYDTEQHFD